MKKVIRSKLINNLLFKLSELVLSAKRIWSCIENPPPIIIDGLSTDTQPVGYEYYCYKIDFELQVIYKVSYR